MPEGPVVAVVPAPEPGLWITTCTQHGPMAVWTDPGLAGFDLMGHVAQWHQTPPTGAVPGPRWSVVPYDALCATEGCAAPAVGWREDGVWSVTACGAHLADS